MSYLAHGERQPDLDPQLRSLTHYRRRGPGADFEILVNFAQCKQSPAASFWIPWTLLTRNATWRQRLYARWSVWEAQRTLGEHQCNVSKPLRGHG
jgi:hypothetical protein